MTIKSLILPLLFASLLSGQSITSLEQEIVELLKEKSATVGVSIQGPDPEEIISINGDKQLPMQSVYKFHLALAVLDKVDKGIFSLDDRITITKADVDTKLWSPIRDKYPDGVELSLSEVLKYTVSLSDNVGCDVLFRLIGDTAKLEEYLHQVGIRDVRVVYNEEDQQGVWERQFENWTTANAANLALRLFYENEEALLSPESHDFLWTTMKGTTTGKRRIKGNLPDDTIVAHKTGSSGRNANGLTGARNDIGIVFLPDGTCFYISVLVSNSMETDSVNDQIIADVARLAWDYFESQ